MGCTSCATKKGEAPKGCRSNGHCATGGCNKMNTFDWLDLYDFHDPTESNLLEISFKQGARKEFHVLADGLIVHSGDWVVVETGNGWDVGEVSLTGALVDIQMKKKGHSRDRVIYRVLRIATDRDMEKMKEAREKETPALIRSRAIARTLDLKMKIGDVEYQADHKKATFYYTAEGRIDFRELVRSYAKEFRVKVEMRQIGSRQESARIGGLGPCGRELCCSTWLSNFQSVSTTAARYQNLAINQAKLSGQCGRLKCCLNYELDTYLEALEDFPKNVDNIRSKTGKASLIKLDIFKGLMYYSVEMEQGRNRVIALEVDQVWKIKELNEAKEYPEDLFSFVSSPSEDALDDYDFADVTGEIELPTQKRSKRRKSRRGRNRNPQNRRRSDNNNSRNKHSKNKKK